MKGSFLLGIIGGIFAILVAFGLFFIAGMLEALGQAGYLEASYGQVGVGILGGILGIIGGAIGKRAGGTLLIIASLLSLIAASLFGILPFVLLLVGGILAIREKREGEETKIHKPKDKMEKKVVGVIILSIVVLVLIVLPILVDVLELMPEAKVKEREEKPTPTPTPTPQKNLFLMETSYNPAFNFTVVKIANIGSKTLYNITVVSEFGDATDFPMPVKPSENGTMSGFQVGLPGQVSKVTVYYATEPNGKKLEEKFEWT